MSSPLASSQRSEPGYRDWSIESEFRVAPESWNQPIDPDRLVGVSAAAVPAAYTEPNDSYTMSSIRRFSGPAERDRRIHEWLDARTGELGAIARGWFARMRRCDPDVREILHDGYATVCVDDAPFAYVGVFRAHVNVGFFRGSTLADPEGLLVGTGKHMRHMRLEA